MDKFGIFNLLNSFLNPDSRPNEQSSDACSPQPTAPQDLLGNLFNNLKSGSPQKNEAPTAHSVAPQPIKPLQRQMLSTITAHDELIKRVNKSGTIKK